jgi:hypothetical protein
VFALVAIVYSGTQASKSPNHEITGAAAIPWIIMTAIWYMTWIFGFLRYAQSKGYSKWLGFWLSLGQVPGMIALFLLPDQRPQ